jgi:hypothetical protein
MWRSPWVCCLGQERSSTHQVALAKTAATVKIVWWVGYRSGASESRKRRLVLFTDCIISQPRNAVVTVAT